MMKIEKNASDRQILESYTVKNGLRIENSPKKIKAKIYTKYIIVRNYTDFDRTETYIHTLQMCLSHTYSISSGCGYVANYSSKTKNNNKNTQK